MDEITVRDVIGDLPSLESEETVYENGNTYLYENVKYRISGDKAYVGNWFNGYKYAVIEAVEGGVVIRELADSEAINGKFTHYGYLKGVEYGN